MHCSTVSSSVWACYCLCESLYNSVRLGCTSQCVELLVVFAMGVDTVGQLIEFFQSQSNLGWKRLLKCKNAKNNCDVLF